MEALQFEVAQFEVVQLDVQDGNTIRIRVCL
jgi:hypothetical protein